MYLIKNRNYAEKFIKSVLIDNTQRADNVIFAGERPEPPVKKDEPIEETKEHIIN